MESMHHQVDHGDTDHGFAGFGEGFIVFREAAVFSKPCKCSLDNPPLGKDNKLVSIRSLDDFNDPAIPAHCPIHKPSGITAIGPDHFEASPPRTQLFYEQFTAVTVLDVGRVNDQSENQAKRVNNDMTLAPKRFLARIVPSVAPFSAVLTDWLSMIPALGVGLRPFLIRTCDRSRS